MTDARPGRLALARMRALGAAPIRADTPEETVVNSALAAGRSILDIIHKGEPAQILSWLDGYEPSQEEGAGVEYPHATTTELEALAVCLGCCWRDRHVEPWPGEPCERQDVLAAIGWVKEDDRHGTLGRYERALARLERALWIEFEGARVRLGPRVAAWKRDQTAVLREVFDLLPHLPEHRAQGNEP